MYFIYLYFPLLFLAHSIFVFVLIYYKIMDKLTFLNKLEKYFFTYDYDLIFFTEVELLRSQCRNALKEMIQFNEVDKRRHWIVIFREMINICNNYCKPHNKDLEIEVNGQTILLDHKYIISYEFYEFVLYLTKDESLQETAHLTITEITNNIKNSLHRIKDLSSTYLLSELLLLVVGVKMSFTEEYLITVTNILESSIKENNFTFVNVHEITIHLKLITDLVEDSMIKQNIVLLDRDSEFRKKLEDLSKLIVKCPILISVQFENIKTKLINYDRVHNVDASCSVNQLGFDDQTPFNLKLIPNESINCEEVVDITML